MIQCDYMHVVCLGCAPALAGSVLFELAREGARADSQAKCFEGSLFRLRRARFCGPSLRPPPNGRRVKDEDFPTRSRAWSGP
eukprot:13443605-Alexandrium_andersonii.AAC.1